MLTLVEFGASYDIFQVGRNGTATLDGGFSMVLYEVNLVVQKHLDGDYLPWLQAHIEEMLEFQGFERASLWLETDSEQDDALRYTVHYEISSKADLETYFTEHAERMRGWVNKFPEGVRAERQSSNAFNSRYSSSSGHAHQTLRDVRLRRLPALDALSAASFLSRLAWSAPRW